MADNEFSQPSLIPPAIPDSFERDAGTSKTELVYAIFELLKRSQIVGITQSSPNPLDITQIASDLAALEARVTVDEAGILTYRKVIASIVDGVHDITFPTMSGTDYQVQVTFISAVATDSGDWTIISKTATSVRIKVLNSANNPDMEVVIRQAPASL